MSVVFAEDITPTAPQATARVDDRTLWLESFDGSLKVPFNGDPLKLLVGAIGLDKPPETPVIITSPDVPGGFIEEVQTGVRRIMLPAQVRARTQARMRETIANLRDVLRYGESATREGSCYLMGSSASGVRRFTVAYVSGLEGESGGMPNLNRFGLNLVAVNPYAYDRDVRPLPFGLPSTSAADAFLSDDPTRTFATRALVSSTVFGQNMAVNIDSEIPVYPRLDFIGPLDPLQVTASTGLSISVPGGVPSGQTLTVITDPRGKSIRLGGERAAGLLELGWDLGAPFRPGLNRMDVVAPGATAASKVLVSWRGGWESLWG